MSDLNMHMDSGESVFFTRELEKIRAKSYDVKFKETKLLNILPWSTEGDPYMDSITHRSFTRVGMAKMGGGQYATDFPRVDVYGTEVTVKVKPVHDSYGYNLDEIRAAAKVNKPLEAMRANAARKAIDMKLEEIAVQGEATTGLNGLFNHPDISEYTVPDGTAGTTDWESKTSDEILADLNGIVNYIITSTNGIETPDIMALPLTSFNVIAQKRLSTDSEKTVLKYFLENNPYIKRVEWFTELETMGAAGGDSTKRFVAWKNDPDHLVLDMPMPFTQEETLKDGLEYVVPCRSKTAGVTFFYPLSACFGDGI
jgi:hypothetical protein